MLRELRLEHGVHDADVDGEPVRAAEAREARGLAERVARGREAPDALCEVWVVRPEFVGVKYWVGRGCVRVEREEGAGDARCSEVG